MHLEKRNPAMPSRARGAEVGDLEINLRQDDTPTGTASQLRAAAKLAARFGLTASVAMVVATLSGLGGEA